MKPLRYLLAIARAFPKAVAGLFASTQITIIVGMLSGGYIARHYLNHMSAVDGVASGPSFGLAIAIVLLVVSQSAGIIGMAAWMFSDIRVSRQGMAMLSMNIVERILRRPGGLPLPDDPQKHRPISEGQCLNTLSQDTVVLPSMLGFLFEMMSMLASGCIAFVILLRINALTTLSVFLPLAALFVILERLRRNIEPLSEQARRSAGEVSSLIGDMFNCIQTVKTAAAEDSFIQEFERRNARRLKDSLRAELFFTLLRSVNSGLVEIGAGIVLLTSAAALQGSTLTVGDFMLFLSYLWAVLAILRWGGMLLAEFKRINVAIGRMEALMHPEPPLAPARKRRLSLHKVEPLNIILEADASGPLRSLEARNLCYRYPLRRAPTKAEDEQAESCDPSEPAFGIEDVSFRLEGGSLTVLTGSIGSGKTTLLKCLIGLLPTQSGVVSWNGQPVASSSELEAGSFFQPPRCAYTPQVPRLFSESLRENILLGLPEANSQLDAVIRQACLEQDIKEMPDGLDTQIGPRGVRLSGGQVQRTAAARMFARRASLYLLDDISSALDVDTEKLLWERLRDQAAGRTTYLVVSHREALLRQADQILLMDRGRLVARGSFQELRAGSALFRSLLREASSEQAEPAAVAIPAAAGSCPEAPASGILVGERSDA